MRFAPGAQPFWSITMYDSTFNFTPNAINRYATGDRTPGFKRGADGGLTLYIRHIAGKDRESNWLPSPGSGSFMLVMPTNLPGADVMEQKWAPRKKRVREFA